MDQDTMLRHVTSNMPSDTLTRCLLTTEEAQNIDTKTIAEEQRDTARHGEHTVVRGITAKFVLHRGRTEALREDVRALLDTLPEGFRQTKGGGQSLLNASPEDTQWEHRETEALLVLGLALGLVEYTLPRELWHTLPGSMPYITYRNDP